jgi:hypothetical protein
MFRETLRWLILDIVHYMEQVDKGDSNELENRKQSVADMVVKGRFVSF